MPKDFDVCVSRGGRVRTISGPNKRFGVPSGSHRKVCFPKGGGKMTLGYVKRNVKSEEMKRG